MTWADVFDRFRPMKRPTVNLVLLFLIALVFASCGPVAIVPVSSPRQGVGNLRAEQLKILLNRKDAIFLVDTRTEYEFKAGRIPGAVNIPPHKFRSLGEMLPRDKYAHLVFYCRGSGCEPSKQAAVAAWKLGYRNVDTYLAGYPAWIAKGYDIEK
jgi:rhodanese-related sulfurtransferase